MHELNLKEIQESGVFKTNAELIKFLILYYLSQVENAVGSWILNDQLNRVGVKTSLATVGRILKTLDREEFTLQENGQGRVITPEGNLYLTAKVEEIRKTKLNNQLLDSVKIASVKQLMDLFRARIIIETEVVKMATQAADQKDLQYLEEIVEEANANLDNIPLVTKLNAQFHTEIARIADNQFLISSINILMDEQWGIETDHHEMREGYNNEANDHYHKMILEAMQQGDAEKAAKRMRKHLEALRDNALKGISLKS